MSAADIDEQLKRAERMIFQAREAMLSGASTGVLSARRNVAYTIGLLHAVLAQLERARQ